MTLDELLIKLKELQHDGYAGLQVELRLEITHICAGPESGDFHEEQLVTRQPLVKVEVVEAVFNSKGPKRVVLRGV